MSISDSIRADVRREQYDYLGEYVALAKSHKRFNSRRSAMVIVHQDCWRLPKSSFDGFASRHKLRPEFMLQGVLLETTSTHYIIKPLPA